MSISGTKKTPEKATKKPMDASNAHTIRRVEKKYLITRSEKAALLKAIKKHLKRDEYYKEEVISLYLDTDNFDLAIKTIDRPNFREKIRVRAYNIPKRSTKVFFEVKTKLAADKVKIGNKRRLIIPLKEFYTYINTGKGLEQIASKASDGNPQQIQVARELDYLIKHYGLKPKILIISNRTAFSGKNDSNFRLTFDENLRFRTTDLKLEKASTGEKYFPSTSDPKRGIIMEAKTINAMPPWFVDEISRLKIYPTRFSKYGKIYQLITERNK